LLGDPAIAPVEKGVLVIDEHGDRKWGKHTAHVGRQWLANIGKTENGVVSVRSLWADKAVYWRWTSSLTPPLTTSAVARTTRLSAPS
jgi:SRSO17 transposase